LHERLGFSRAGTYDKVGWKQGGWWDVGLWQRSLAPATVPPAEPRPWREVGIPSAGAS
jgi:phosphinothricin acetyltransferase